MNDFLAILATLALGSMVVALVASRFSKAEQGWIWVAMLARLAGAAGQLMHARVEGGDQNGYRYYGNFVAHALDLNFSWAAPETMKMLFQRPSALDGLVGAPGTNTGSMCAASGWLFYVAGHSDYGVQTILAVLSLVAAVMIYASFRKAAPDANHLRLLVATALFPSVAFWTTGLLKETFCIFGIGMMLLGWRGFYERRYVRGVLLSIAGVVWTLMFRAPALPPVALGIAIYVMASRKGATKPINILLGVGLLVGGVLLVGLIAPELALGNISESVTTHQRSWTANATTGGGSGYDLEEIDTTPAEQLARAPIAMVNALLRPQLFDVRNPLMLVSALEMTALLYLLIRVVRTHGFRGTARRIGSSPLLLMCAAITVVGSTFVGLTTLNFGSLARYRTPFLPFYGMLLAVLSDAPSKAKVAAPKGAPLRLGPPRRRLVPRREIRTG